MDYSDLLLSGVELAEKMDGREFYPSGSPYRPDLFTDLVLEALVLKFGSVSAFCSQLGLNFPRLLRGLTPLGMEDESLSALAVKAVCEELGLSRSDFLNRMYEPETSA